MVTTVGGHRIDLDGVLEAREVLETERPSPRDRTEELLRLRLAVELTDWLRFDSTTVGINGGPRFRATRAGTYNLNDTFQDVDPSIEVEEAYADLDLHPLDLRLGKQKLHWGKLDRTQPNDIFNPYQFEDPILQEQDERKIGIPAVVADYSVAERPWLPQQTEVTLAWAPIFVPDRFVEPGDRWFPPAAENPGLFIVPEGLIDIPGQPPLPALEVPLTLETRNVTPARRLDNSSLALRLSGYTHGLDFALYYYHGIDTSPAFRLLVDALNEPPGLHPSARTFLEPAFAHVDSWGADGAYTFGPVTVRAEGAFIRGRPYSRDLRLLVANPAEIRDQLVQVLTAFEQGAREVPVDILSYVTRDSFEWGIGADYTLDGWFLLLQLNQTDIFHNDVDLLISDVESRALVNLRKSFARDTVHAQVIAMHAIDSDYTLVLPRLTVDITDNLDVRIGYLAIAGSEHSLLGQYKRNDEGFMRLRYSF